MVVVMFVFVIGDVAMLVTGVTGGVMVVFSFVDGDMAMLLTGVFDDIHCKYIQSTCEVYLGVKYCPCRSEANPHSQKYMHPSLHYTCTASSSILGCVTCVKDLISPVRFI
jgi:hypothetical protein